MSIFSRSAPSADAPESPIPLALPSIDSMTGEAIELRPGVMLQACYTPGNQPAVVFLHGGLGNRLNWRSQFEFAQAQGWSALAYDLAGHGQSSVYPRYSIGRHSRDLTRLLQHLQIQSPLLCCHSYGVPLGLEWVQRHPTTALILIAGGTHDLDPWWEVPLMQWMTWSGRHLYRLPFVQSLSQRLTSSYHHPTVQRFFADCPMPVDRTPYEALQIFWGYDFFARYQTANHNRHIPTLVISGGQDPMFTAEMGDALASQFQPSDHLHLLHAGHILMAEYPDRVNQAIATWRQQWADPGS